MPNSSNDIPTQTARDAAMGALIRAADRLLDGALGNGHSISVSKSHFDALIDAVRKAKAS